MPETIHDSDELSEPEIIDDGNSVAEVEHFLQRSLKAIREDEEKLKMFLELQSLRRHLKQSSE